MATLLTSPMAPGIMPRNMAMGVASNPPSTVAEDTASTPGIREYTGRV